MSGNEYKFFGLTPDKISVVFGVLLVIFGVLMSFLSGSTSVTSYIPSILGMPVLVFGLISIFFPTKQRLFMHLNVFLGLIIFLGGLSVFGNISSGSLFGDNFFADISKLFMVVSGFIYLAICIKSFFYIRKQRDMSTSKN